MANIKTLTKGDNIFATLVAKGKILKTLVGRNFTNLNQVVKMACGNCEGYRGLAQLSVRNQSQGWNVNMLLRIDRGESAVTTNSEKEPLLDGLQYRFAF